MNFFNLWALRVRGPEVLGPLGGLGIPDLFSRVLFSFLPPLLVSPFLGSFFSLSLPLKKCSVL